MADDFDERIEKAFRTLAIEFQDREQLANQLRLQIDQRIDQRLDTLQNQLRTDFGSMVQAHRDHITDLYKKFERIVWMTILLIAGVTVFIGYQEFANFPDKINAAISRLEADKREQVKVIQENTITELKTTLTTEKAKISTAVTTAETEISDAITTAKGQISTFASTVNKQKLAAEKRIGVATSGVDQEVENATKKIRDMIENFGNEVKTNKVKLAAVISAAQEDAKKRLQFETSRYKQEVEIFRVEDDLAALGREKTQVARYRRLLSKAASKELSDEHQILLLERIDSAELLDDLTPQIVAMLESLEPFQGDVEALEASKKEQVEAVRAYQFRLGLRYEVEKIVRETKQRLRVNLESDDLLRILGELEALGKRTRPRSPFTRRDSGKIFQRFRANLRELVVHPNLDVRSKATLLLLDLRNHSAAERANIAEFIRLSRDTAEGITGLVEIIGRRLPADQSILFALLETLNGQSKAGDAQKNMIAAVTMKYLRDNRKQMNVTGGFLSDSLRTLEASIAESDQVSRSILNLIQKQIRFEESSIVVLIEAERTKKIVDRPNVLLKANIKFSNSEYTLTEVQYGGPGEKFDIFTFSGKIQYGVDEINQTSFEIAIKRNGAGLFGTLESVSVGERKISLAMDTGKDSEGEMVIRFYIVEGARPSKR